MSMLKFDHNGHSIYYDIITVFLSFFLCHHFILKFSVKYILQCPPQELEKSARRVAIFLVYLKTEIGLTVHE